MLEDAYDVFGFLGNEIIVIILCVIVIDTGCIERIIITAIGRITVVITTALVATSDLATLFDF